MSVMNSFLIFISYLNVLAFRLCRLDWNFFSETLFEFCINITFINIFTCLARDDLIVEKETSYILDMLKNYEQFKRSWFLLII